MTQQMSHMKSRNTAKRETTLELSTTGLVCVCVCGRGGGGGEGGVTYFFVSIGILNHISETSQLDTYNHKHWTETKQRAQWRSETRTQEPEDQWS